MLELDLVLAILHHLFVFALFGVLFVEFVSVRRGMDAAAVTRICMIDNWYSRHRTMVAPNGWGGIIDRRRRVRFP